MNAAPRLVILLVDDVAINRRRFREIIQRSCPGVEIVEACSEEEADRAIDANPRLMAAVVDACLPDEHTQKGLNVLAYLRRMQPDCMRILVTSRLQERDVKDRANVEAFVSFHHSKSNAPSMLADALGEASRRYWRCREPESVTVGAVSSVPRL